MLWKHFLLGGGGVLPGWNRKVSRWLGPGEEAPLPLQQEAVGLTAQLASLQKSCWWKWDEQRVFSVGTRTPKPLQKGPICALPAHTFSANSTLEQPARENGKTHLRDKSTPVPSSCFSCFALRSALARDYIAMYLLFSWVQGWDLPQRVNFFHLGGLS